MVEQLTHDNDLLDGGSRFAHQTLQRHIHQ
jgi:hypothetical protein